MKWLIRRIQKFFSGKPFITEGSKYWLAETHYARYREFTESLQQRVDQYRKEGLEWFNSFHTEDYIETGYRAKLFLDDHFKYLADKDRQGRRIDNWEVPSINDDGTIVNDCDGYAGFAMMLMLLDEVPRKDLRIATCWLDKPDGNDYHMVLIIKTNEGDFVLDNTNKYIWRWDKLDFHWHYMEDGIGGFVKIIN